jgi:alpha-N-arabinofuranosidase
MFASQQIALIISLFITISFASSAENKNVNNVVSLNIENANTGQGIPSTMHGMILETNINRGDDGGLYAELIYNRAFQERGRSLDGWSSFGQGSITVTSTQPLSQALPAQMRYSLATTSTSPSGFQNGGFSGINVQAQNYTVSFFYRPLTGASIPGGKLNVGLSDSAGQTRYGVSAIDVSKAPLNSWFQLSANVSVFTAAPSTKNLFFVEFPTGSMGNFEFNLISCFPPTFKNRTNGARVDIAQAFADLKPGYVRLPGGNDVEGPSIAERFIWNATIGPLENRPGRRGSWIGYNTEGFGLLELITFVEDIGATPLLAVYAGYSLDRETVPEGQLQPYIDEVINELLFLTSPADENPLGALRKSLGRERPVDIKYVEIGNEDFFAADSYKYRWPAFYSALKEKFPEINFIATTTAQISSPPIVDDHNYEVPQFFINNFRRYENIPRPTPEVVVGEFSVINDDDSYINNPFSGPRLDYPSVKGAVAESIYRIGLERNTDVIIGNCYAPVLQNIDYTQWTPNLIVFNANTVVKTTSYLAQKMFGQNLGDLFLNSTATNSSMFHESVRKGEEGDGKLGNLYFVATKRTSDNTLIVKLANVDPNDTVVKAQIQGSTTSSQGVAYTLTAGPGVDPSKAKNTIANPTAISITTAPVSSSSGSFSVTIPSWGVVVVTIQL